MNCSGDLLYELNVDVCRSDCLKPNKGAFSSEWVAGDRQWRKSN